MKTLLSPSGCGAKRPKRATCPGLRALASMGLLVVLSCGAGAAVFAAPDRPLPRLPPPAELAQGDGSPGRVTFDHATHLAARRPDCTTCHPARFSILGRDRGAKRTAYTHDVMDKGALCGACHDGKIAFSKEDDCTRCHKD